MEKLLKGSCGSGGEDKSLFDDEKCTEKNGVRNIITGLNEIDKKQPKWVSRNKYLSGGGINRSCTKKKKTPEKKDSKAKQMFECSLCDKVYESNYSLKVHIRTHTGEKPFECSNCCKSFATSFQLERHSFCHSKQSDCMCHICDKTFATKDILTIHLRSHTGDQPFACDKCEKKYPSRSSLNRHLNSHAEEKSFLCDECGKTFLSNATLRLHTQCHVRERRFPCSRCRLRFKRQMDLDRHMKTHQELRRLPCPITGCRHKFRRKDNLLRHLRLTHDQTKQQAHKSYGGLTVSQDQSKGRVQLSQDDGPKDIDAGTQESNIVPAEEVSPEEDDLTYPVLPSRLDEVHSSHRSQCYVEQYVNSLPDLSGTVVYDLNPVSPNSTVFVPVSAFDGQIQSKHTPPPTNQRSVIRTVESLDIRERSTRRIQQPETHYHQNQIESPGNETYQRTSREMPEKCASQPYRDENNQRFLEFTGNYRTNQSEFLSASISPPRTPPAPSSSASECINRGYYTDFRYGTLFPFKPHIMPEKFDYRTVISQKPLYQGYVEPPPIPQYLPPDDNRVLLDLSICSSRDAYPSYPVIPEYVHTYPKISHVDAYETPVPVPLQYELLEPSNQSSFLQVRRPENCSVIRRASPSCIRVNESVSSPNDCASETSMGLKQKLEIQSTPCQTVTQSVSTAQIDYSISSSDKNMESPNSSHEPENKPFHVNQYAIRDPRKNFLWENFNRHYKPS